MKRTKKTEERAVSLAPRSGPEADPTGTDVVSSTGAGWQLLHAAWQQGLADVAVDALITDPPYTERVLLGYRSGSDVDASGRTGKFNISYAAWRREDCSELVAWAVDHVRHWVVIFNDHIGARWLEEDLKVAGWYVFNPIPWVRTNPPPRFAGDGPTNATEWITIARPRGRISKKRSGSRPGYYICAAENVTNQVLVGQKPLVIMRQLVAQYTLPGDLIAEPFCGAGTTMRAAYIEGRRSIGCEIDPETFRLASERLRGLGPSLVNGQPNLFGELR